MERGRSSHRENGYPTAQQAALASYSPAAGAFVVSLRTDGRRAEVEVDTSPSHPCVTTCIKGRYGLWYERGDHR